MRGTSAARRHHATLRDILDAIIRDKREDAARELRFYATQRSLTDAIDVAARSKTLSSKRHPHQYRIPHGSLAEARRRLLAADLCTPQPSTSCATRWPQLSAASGRMPI